MLDAVDLMGIVDDVGCAGDQDTPSCFGCPLHVVGLEGQGSAVADCGEFVTWPGAEHNRLSIEDEI